jgi:WD40 repeat protein
VIESLSARALRHALSGARHSPTNDCAFSDDGRVLASVENATVRLWDVASGEETAAFSVVATAKACEWSPGGERLAVVGYPLGSIELWDTAASEGLGRELARHPGGALGCSFSPDGLRLATCGIDAQARIWDVATGASVATLRGHSAAVHSCSWSPDGSLLATASEDPSVRLWHTETGDLVTVLSGHTDALRACAWQPGGGRLATASADGTARIWDVEVRISVATLTGHAGFVVDCAWSADGLYVATAGADSTVRLWEAATGSAVAGIDLDQWAYCLAAHPVSPLFACGDRGGSVYLVELAG